MRHNAPAGAGHRVPNRSPAALVYPAVPTVWMCVALCGDDGFLLTDGTKGRTAPYRSALHHRIRLREPNSLYRARSVSEGSCGRNSATLRHVFKRNCERQRADSFHDLWILRKKATDLIHY